MYEFGKQSGELTGATRLRLDEFELDLKQRRLYRDGVQVSLANKPFQVLAYLIEHRDRLVTREELLREVWQGQDVYDDALRKAVSAIRKALDERGDPPRFIETRHGLGYRFLGTVTTGAAPAATAISAPTSPEPDAAEAPPAQAMHPAITAPFVRRPRWAVMTLAASLSVIVMVAFLVYRQSRASDAAAAAPPRSIAVLPLKNLTGDAAWDFFSDGVTETLINELSKIPDVKVISRGSVFRFKDRETDPREVGRQLGVATVLEGGVRHGNGTVRVAVRLVSATDGNVLWASDTYNRPLQDILAVEEEIGCNIAEHLRTRLCQDQPPGTHPETNSVVAYEANLRGRYYLNQRTAAGIKRAIEYFQQALALDARYAVAAAGLADAYNLAIWYGFPSTEMLPKARTAALQALELDNTLAEAHLALAQLHRTNWEWAAEERAHQQALRLGANSARVHHSTAYFFAVRGRLDEALAEINRARELDPLNLAINADVAHILYYARRYDEAITQCQRTLELDARFESALTHQRLAELQKGQYQTVITNAQAAIQRGELREFLLASAYAASGQPTEASRLLVALRQRAAREPLPLIPFAHVYTSLGDKDSAFAWLEKAYRQRDAALLCLKVEPLFDPLRADPRFAALIRRVGLEP